MRGTATPEKRALAGVPSRSSAGPLTRAGAACARALRRLLSQRAINAITHDGRGPVRRRAHPLFASAEDERETLADLERQLGELEHELRTLVALPTEARRLYGRLLPRFADQLLREGERTALSAERLCRRSQQLARRLDVQ